MNEAISGLISVALAIVGIAIVAVLVSRQAQTPEVVKAFTGGFAQDIAAAVSPVTGGGIGIGYANSGGFLG